MKQTGFVLLMTALIALLALGVWLLCLGLSLPQSPAFVSPFGSSM